MSIVYKIGFLIAFLLMGIGVWPHGEKEERWMRFVFRLGCVLFAWTYLIVTGVTGW